MENTERNLNSELYEGMSDGAWKKIAQDRSRTPNDQATWMQRRNLYPSHFGFREAKSKVLGDGTVHTTPDYVDNPDPGQYFLY